MSRWRAVVGQGTRLAGSGLVHIGFAVGHFEMVRVAVGGLAGRGGCHGVVTSGAERGGTEGDVLRRFLQVGGRGGTSWDGETRLNAGWGSSGRRVKPVQPGLLPCCNAPSGPQPGLSSSASGTAFWW